MVGRPNQVLLILALLLVVVQFYCVGPDVIGENTEGTITETVGVVGQLVDTVGYPVADAWVTIFDDDSSYHGRSNFNGDYVIETDSVKEGQKYTIQAFSRDSGLAFFEYNRTAEKRLIYRSSGNEPGDSSLFVIDAIDDTLALRSVHIDTMRVPGAVSGRVQARHSDSQRNTAVYIPGTSYSAVTDSAGTFVMSGVPVGTHTLVFSRTGYSEKELVVEVSSGDTLALQGTILLELDPASPPPSPRSLQVTYDTLSGVATLTWDPVPVPNATVSYLIYDRSDNGQYEILDTIVADTVFYDTLFSSLDASINQVKTRQYQVAAFTSYSQPGPRTSVLICTAPSPFFVTTVMNFSSFPAESLSLGDTLITIVHYTNPTRAHRTVRWAVNSNPYSRSLKTPLPSSGSDTLRYIPQEMGDITFHVTITDAAYMAWNGEFTVTVSGVSYVPDTWEACESMQVSRRYFDAVAVGTRLYAIGGAKSVPDYSSPVGYVYHALNTVEVYDTESGKWEFGSALDTARFFHQSVVCQGKIYVFGGNKGFENGGEWSTSIERFDPETGIWTQVGAMPWAREGFAACVIRDSIFLSGGKVLQQGTKMFRDSIDVYDPVTGNWFTKPAALTKSRFYHEMVVAGDTVYIMGGLSFDTQRSIYGYCDSIEAFTLDMTGPGEFTLLEENYPDEKYVPVVIDNKILVVGGTEYDELEKKPKALKSGFRYDPVTGTFMSLQELSYAVQGYGAAVIDNVLYIAGGASDIMPGSEINSVYKYYPSITQK